MKNLQTFITGSLLYIAGSNAIAHPGHEVAGILGQAAHSFSLMDFVVGSALISYLIYQIIKKTS